MQFLVPVSKNVEVSHSVQVISFVQSRQWVMFAVILASHFLHFLDDASAQTRGSIKLFKYYFYFYLH